MFDSLVLISSCDKNVPGHLLGAARLDLPTICVPGGPMAAGRYRGEDIDTTVLDTECWAYGVCKPRISEEELDLLGIVEDGDVIEIDIPNRKLAIQLSKEELESRISRWKPPPPRVTDSFLTVYAKLANPVEKGAGINLRMK